MTTLAKITAILLDDTRLPYTLHQDVMALKDLIVGAQGTPTLFDNAADGESYTENGLAVSPKWAEMCLDEYVRTIQFLRGLNTAIQTAKSESSARPVRVLYVGCGPFATLAMPLMSIYSAEEVVFTLIDIHQESADSVMRVANTLALADRIEHIHVIDALTYQIDPANPLDILVMEIMQASLDKEMQVPVARHILAQAPSVIMVPEAIHVDVKLVQPSVEYDTMLSGDLEALARSRQTIGRVFSLTKETVADWADIKGETLPAATLKIPAFDADTHQLMMFTEIITFSQHRLNNRDTGLTAPQVHPSIVSTTPGDHIQFEYQLGLCPGLVGKLVTEPGDALTT
jgi:hypothetical protein